MPGVLVARPRRGLGLGALALVSLLAACSGEDFEAGPTGEAGQGGAAGSTQPVVAGTSGYLGPAGASGVAGSASGASGGSAAGASGEAGAGESGASGQAGQAGSGQTGKGGQAGSSQAGSGQAGAAGKASAGQSGAAGGAGEGGSQAAGGQAGSSGGEGGSDAGGAGGEGGEAGAGGEAGQGGEGGEGGEGGSAGAAGCETKTKFYKDHDRDGHGDFTKAMEACEPPPEAEQYAWVTAGDDCNDSNAEVFPGQTAFFEKPYPTSGGTTSFDYDCDGAEKGPNSLSLLPDCSGTIVDTCSGKQGYKPTNPDAKNAYCGSETLVICGFKNLACYSSETKASEPYRCR